jgi:hypothetical protein
MRHCHLPAWLDARHGAVLGTRQILGTMAHPSTEGGSQLGVYLGLKTIASLLGGTRVFSYRIWRPHFTVSLKRSTHSRQ